MTIKSIMKRLKFLTMLDKLDALAAAADGCGNLCDCGDEICDACAYTDALRNAAPGLIAVARAAAFVDRCNSDVYVNAYGSDQFGAALNELRDAINSVEVKP